MLDSRKKKNCTWSLSLALSGVTFFVLTILMRPGYWINDDFKIIWNAYGYPNGQATPFLIYSNVILGFILVPLHRLGVSLNWAVLLYICVNFFATWALLHVTLTAPMPSAFRALATMVILPGIALLTLNITYTITAILACAAGVALAMFAARENTAAWIWKACGASALLGIATLIRAQSAPAVLGFALPALLLSVRGLPLRRVLLIGSITALPALVFVAFDALYVRSAPDWHLFYAYTKVRQQLHDTHRLANVHRQIARVGWTSNDQELFARWFYPDGDRYSLENIEYIVSRTPGTSQDVSGTVSAFVATLAGSRSLPYLLVMAGIILWASSRSGGGVSLLAVMFIFAAVLAENVALAWGYKNPDYVLLSTLAASTALGVVVLANTGRASAADLERPGKISTARLLAQIGALGLAAVAASMQLVQAARTSSLNTAKQVAYRAVLADLAGMKVAGIFPQNALIVSPAHGLPVEWSDPLMLEFPPVDTYDTGWVTFSPSYEQVLKKYHIDSLPDALYQREDLFLMSESVFVQFLGKYYQEHRGIAVKFLPIYTLPNTNDLFGYDGIEIYKVVVAK